MTEKIGLTNLCVWKNIRFCMRTCISALCALVHSRPFDLFAKSVNIDQIRILVGLILSWNGKVVADTCRSTYPPNLNLFDVFQRHHQFSKKFIKFLVNIDVNRGYVQFTS